MNFITPKCFSNDKRKQRYGVCKFVIAWIPYGYNKQKSATSRHCLQKKDQIKIQLMRWECVWDLNDSMTNLRSV